jgi:hypothetical protein
MRYCYWGLEGVSSKRVEELERVDGALTRDLVSGWKLMGRSIRFL